MRRVIYLLLLVYGCNLNAQPFKLVKDINASKDFYYNTGSVASHLIELNSYLFVAGEYSPYGRELWKIDKVSGNKSLLKDIYPGMEGSGTTEMIIFNNLIFFAANDGLSGMELWKSDGTADGTVLVKDMNPGTGYSFPGSFIICNNLLFFVANGELWKTDGTAQGTSLVKDIDPVERSLPGDFCVKDGILYFAAFDRINGRELWRSDGTSDGTYMVADIFPGIQYYNPNNSSPADLSLINGYIVFSAGDQNNGREIWRSDGTAAGTSLLKDISPTLGSSDPLIANVTVGNKLFFSAKPTGKGAELWVTDGTSAGTIRVKEISPATPYESISEMVFFKNTIFFRLIRFNSYDQLWKSDGTEQSTVQFRQLQSNYRPFRLIADQNYLYYIDRNLTTGDELWVSNGTDLETRLVKDIEPGSLSSNLSESQYLNGQIYFRAQTSLYGTSLWKSDGNADGTSKFISFPEGTKGSNANFPDPKNLIAFKNELYFTANDSIHGEELWKSDGTESGTFLLKDLTQGVGGSNPSFFAVSGNSLYFQALQKLWKTDGTTAGTVQVHSSATPFSERMVTVNGLLYFVTIEPYGFRIWKSDGTEAGTMYAEALPSTAFTFVNELTPFRGTIYFHGRRAEGGELWKLDTALSRAVRVKNFDPGLDGFPTQLTIAGNYLYCSATTFANGTELWRSDGTEAGTKMLEIMPGREGSNPNNFTVVGDVLYFTATNSLHGTELWKVGGTSQGAVLVKDITPGPGGSDMSHLTNVNEILFFDAYDQQHGYELWKSDGTANGTVMVKETWPGAYGNADRNVTSLFMPAVADKILILTRTNGTNGQEPWFSNGTEAGTMMIQDIFPGTGSSIPNNYVIAGDKIYFLANMPGTGVELWAGYIKDIYPKLELTLHSRLLDSNAVLDWQTLHERALDKFEIQRSTDGVNFTTLGQSIPKGGLGIPADYSFTDSNVNLLNKETIHYRLGIRDTAGIYSYSDTVVLMMPNPVTSNSIKVWPIPSPGDLNISIALIESDDINFVLYDVQGRAVKKWSSHFEKGINSKTIHLQVLNAGVYYLSVQGHSLQQLIKVIKM